MNHGSLAILNSTIADNDAGFSWAGFGTNYQPDNNGGGIDNFGSLTLVNSTIAHNQAVGFGFGGGLYDNAGVTYTSGQTVVALPGALATLDNTIVALNTDSSGTDDIAGVAPSLSSDYNLVGSDETDSLINGQDGNLVGIADPGLDPNGLQGHGGPTPTIALTPGSPAIDAGSVAVADAYALTTDQRGAGFPRIANGTVNIGALNASPARAGQPPTL